MRLSLQLAKAVHEDLHRERDRLVLRVRLARQYAEDIRAQLEQLEGG